MSDSEIIVARLDEIARDVRKQGRAALAAQASAEACLELVRTLAQDDTRSADDADVAEAQEREAERWLRAMIPVADAIDRVLRRAKVPVAKPTQGWWERMFGGTKAVVQNDDWTEGLGVLQRQLDDAFAMLGVVVERPQGLVEPEHQRVVEVRQSQNGQPRGTILEVLRAGYRLNARRVRDADVVAVGGPDTTQESAQ